jgi:tetratricopeptide (TPR) repeat protein
MAEGGWDVFVSYGHGDAEWVQVLAGNLHRAGFDVFLDVWELAGGDRVTGRLEEGIRGSANGVLVVSPHSLSRPWVREEYAALLLQAVERPGRRLIPVLLTDAELPPFLATRLYVDFRGLAATGPGYDARLGELVRALRALPPADRPARDSPREWPAAPDGQRLRAAGPLQATLNVGPAEVILACNGAEPVRHRPRGLQRATVSAAAELAWRRMHPRPTAGPGEEDAALAHVGRLLSEDFLAGPAGAALASQVAAAESFNETLELGLVLEDDALADLPWETLICPQPAGEVAEAGGSPLVLHRNVAMYRQLSDPGVAPVHKVRGPLRLLVVIASPDTGGGELLDYEAELARIVAAVEPARRRGRAYVRILNEGSLAAIAAALAEDLEGFHVLHISCHARPGELILEDPHGAADPVTTRRLLDEGVTAGADLPMIVLSGCSTGLAARQQQASPGNASEQAGHYFKDGLQGETVLASFAAELVAAGVPQVLAMQAPVTDAYATQLAAEMYRRLATGASPDPLLALAAARRSAERDRLALPAGSPRRGRAEWAVPALLARGLRLPLFNPREPFGEIRPPQDPVLAEGVVVRGVGEFIGRRAEARQARRTLAGPKPGLIIHGIGGVGKSTFAAEVLRSLGEDTGLVVSRAGPLLVDDLLGEVGGRIYPAAEAGPLAQAALALRARDIEWADRWRLLAEQILPALAMTVLLDNFEDNLHHNGDSWVVGDPELADLLGRWTTRPGRSRLLITSRHPFTLPGQAARRLGLLQLGPLSPAETRKLIWRLPGVDALEPAEKDRAYRDVGGHPRALEYLDALLRGRARFDDIAARMETQLRDQGIADPAAWLAAQGRDLDSSLAEAITLAASDTLLHALLQQLAATPLARELIIGAAVYRVPVDDTALIFQIGQPTQRRADPQRQQRLERVEEALAKAEARAPGSKISLEHLGFSAEEYAQVYADLAEQRRPPYAPPAGLQAAIRVAEDSGLLTPVRREDQAPFHWIHRWSAAAVASLHPVATKEAHQRAAAFWRWRVDNMPQGLEQSIEQLLEARFHHHAAGQLEEAVAETQAAVLQLETWGQYGRAAELCHDTLTWLAPGSAEAVAFQGQIGILAHRRGDLAAAERSYRQSLAIEERLGNQAGMATTYHQLGLLAQDRGDYSDAETLYRQSLAIEERLGNQAGMADSYHQLGRLGEFRGDYSGAENLYRKSLAMREGLGDRAGMATTYHQLGMLAQDRGDYPGAETLYRQSLAIEERLGNQVGMATSYHQLGVLAKDRGEYSGAETLYRQALAIQERLGDRAGMSDTYHSLGVLAQLRGDYPGAETFYRQALAISEQLGRQPDVASVRHSLGVLAQLRGDYPGAETLCRQALATYERLGAQADMAVGYHQLGVLAQLQDDYPGAEALYRRALAISEQLGYQVGMAASYHQLGMLAQSRDDYPGAEACYGQALAINERLGNQADMATTCRALAEVCEITGNSGKAVALGVRALNIRLQVGIATGEDVRALGELRRKLGVELFQASLPPEVDAESAANLRQILDEWDSSAEH